jgi:hypothetical protein
LALVVVQAFLVYLCRALAFSSQGVGAEGVFVAKSGVELLGDLSLVDLTLLDKVGIGQRCPEEVAFESSFVVGICESLYEVEKFPDLF